MQYRYFLTLLVVMAFSTGMNEHGGAFDGLEKPLIAQDSIYKDNSDQIKGASGGGKGKDSKKSGQDSGRSVRDVVERPPVKDREKVQDRVPVKRP